MISRKQVIIWMLQAFMPTDLEVIDWGPNGAVVIDRRLQETIREDQSWQIPRIPSEAGGARNAALPGRLTGKETDGEWLPPEPPPAAL